MFSECLFNGHMYDDVFRRIFTKPDNLDLVADLIASILEMQVSEIQHLEFLTNELPPEQKGGKSCRLDLFVGMDGRLVNLELQYGHSGGFFMRNAFSLSRLISLYTKQGQPFEDLPKINVINLIDFSFDRIQSELDLIFGLLSNEESKDGITKSPKLQLCPGYPFISNTDKKFHKTVQVCSGEIKPRPTCNQLFHYLELGNVPPLTREIVVRSRKLLWLWFFKISSEEDFNTLYAVEDKVMRKALHELRHAMSETAYAINELKISKAEHSAASALYNAGLAGEAKGLAKGLIQGEAIGLAKGKAEGRVQEKAELTGKLLSSKIPDCPVSFCEQVQASTDLDWLDRVFNLALSCSSWEELQAKGL